jgi:hypothetical protein
MYLKFWFILEALGMKCFIIFFDHFVIFSQFWYILSRKIWQPCPASPDDVVAVRNGVLAQAFVAPGDRRDQFAVPEPKD